MKPVRINPHKVIAQDTDAQDVACGGILDTFGSAFQSAIDAVAETIDDVASLISGMGELTLCNNRTQVARVAVKKVAPADTKMYTLKVPPKSNISSQMLIQVVRSVPGLKHIVLDGNTLTRAHLAALKECRMLSSISIVGCQLKDSDLLELKGISSLQSLNISANTQVKGTLFDKALPASLGSLSADGCDLGDEALARCSHLTKLRFASFAANPRIFGEMLLKLPKSLQELHCNDCSIRDLHLPQLMYHGNLQTLNVANNPEVTGESFYFLEALQTLNCSDCPIRSLDFPTKLQKLMHTMQFTEKQAEALIKRCPDLREAVLEAYSNERLVRDHFGSTGFNLITAFQKRLREQLNDPRIKIVLIPNTRYFTILHSEKHVLDDLKKVLKDVPSCLERGSGWKIAQLQESDKDKNKLFEFQCVSGGRTYKWIPACVAMQQSSPLLKTAFLTEAVFQRVINPKKRDTIKEMVDACFSMFGAPSDVRDAKRQMRYIL